MFKGRSRDEGVREFPALAAYFEHSKLGGFLFDAGYSQAVRENGVVSAVYGLLNPVTMRPKDSIPLRLLRFGIDPAQVKGIVLSHAHPDHMGGASFFPDASIILSSEAAAAIERPSVRDLVFANMARALPRSRRALGPPVGHELLSRYFGAVFDVFGDGAAFAVSLEGHAVGQIGLYLPCQRVLLAADAAWGAEFLDLAGEMKLLPRLVQRDFDAYCATARSLARMKADHPEIDIVFSHDLFKEGPYAEDGQRDAVLSEISATTR